MLQDAFEFYYRAAELKDMLRQGALQWRVNKQRLESIAEHTFGTMILAIALQSELKLHIDMENVLQMLTIHELEELVIGDVTPLDNVEKNKIVAKKGVFELVKNLNEGEKLIALTNEYNARKTLEAKFAKAVDKLECVLEFKKYQDLGQVSLANLTPDMLKNKRVKQLVAAGKYDLADIFFLYHLPAYEEFGIDEKYWQEKLKRLPIGSAKL